MSSTHYTTKCFRLPNFYLRDWLGLKRLDVFVEVLFWTSAFSGQAYQVDADSEKILASIVNIRDQPGSPEKDFSASLLGIYTDFKRFVTKL